LLAGRHKFNWNKNDCATVRTLNIPAGGRMNGKLVEYPMIPFKLEEEMFSDQRRIQNGKVLKPTADGIGIYFSDDIENRYEFDDEAVYSCVVVERGQPPDEYWKDNNLK
tara:strand:+ start:1203 stop:1529 length:327 start_codon:yes stop_codon:yes gene_type:complete